jgi:hypothetical protein
VALLIQRGVPVLLPLSLYLNITKLEPASLPDSSVELLPIAQRGKSPVLKTINLSFSAVPTGVLGLSIIRAGRFKLPVIIPVFLFIENGVSIRFPSSSYRDIAKFDPALFPDSSAESQEILQRPSPSVLNHKLLVFYDVPTGVPTLSNTNSVVTMLLSTCILPESLN